MLPFVSSRCPSGWALRVLSLYDDTVTEDSDSGDCLRTLWVDCPMLGCVASKRLTSQVYTKDLLDMMATTKGGDHPTMCQARAFNTWKKQGPLGRWPAKLLPREGLPRSNELNFVFMTQMMNEHEVR